MKMKLFWFAFVCAISATLCAQNLQNLRGGRLNRLSPGRLNRPTSSLRNGANAQQQAAGEEKPATTREDLKNVPKGTNGVPALAFNQAPLELVLDSYAEQLGKTILPSPELPKVTISLRSLEGQTLTKEEYLEAIEVTLTMNGVVLEPRGEKFLRALPRKTVRTQGIPILMGDDRKNLPEQGRVVSKMIQLRNITVEEAQKALDGLRDQNNGPFLYFERTNAILVTDTQENINRMIEIIKVIDVSTPVLEEVFVRQIKFAPAVDIAAALDKIIAESAKFQEQAKTGPKESGAPGFGTTKPPPPAPSRLLSLTRPGQQQQPPSAPPQSSLVVQVSDADRGMIRGKVVMYPDERSNKLIVITMKTNMDFFDKVIETLDVETTPEVSVEVIRLKYADAEDVSSMLNDLIGAGGSSATAKNNTNANVNKNASGKQNITQNTSTRPRAGAGSNPTFSNNSNLGELNKDNIKILADKRINGIVVMARRADMKAVKEVIEDMDVKLSQVLLETVIVQVELGDDLATGIDWVQRGRQHVYGKVQRKDEFGNNLFYAQDAEGNLLKGTLVPEGYTGTDSAGNAIEASSVGAFKTVKNLVRDGFYNNGSYMAGGGGGSGTAPLKSLFGVTESSSSSSSSSTSEDGETGSSVAAAAGTAAELGANPIGNGINYMLKSDKLNIAAVIQAAKSDSRSKVLASPILMTVDNKEATIEATDMIYLFAGYQYSGSTYSGSQVRNYEKRDIGLTVKVTPKINPNGSVMLTIEEKIESQGPDQSVPNESGGTDPYATVVTRKLQSDISVENRQTVVMGGLTKTTKTESESGIPILKDIPWIGKWLFGSVNMSDKRSELLVFITPYVMDDAAAAQFEAQRRKKALSDPRPWDDNGWSASPLADPVSRKEQLRRFKDEWARQDEERKTKLAIEKAKMDRAKRLKEMSKEEREFWLKLHKEELEGEQREEFEKKLEEQKDLRQLVDSIKKTKMDDAEKEIKDAEAKDKNEYRKDVDRRAEDGKPLPAGETLKEDVAKAISEKVAEEKELKEVEKEAEEKDSKEPEKPAAPADKPVEPASPAPAAPLLGDLKK